jgi:large subunit ribosomal protein L21
MASAVIRTGGKQYRVAEGDTIQVEKLSGAPGDKIQFDDVLLVEGDSIKVGAQVASAKVEGQILDQGRGKKIIVFKFLRRKRSRKKAGHRQSLTSVRITSIQG